MQFQKLSIQTTPTEGIGISWGWWNLGEGGGVCETKQIKEMHEAQSEFRG